MRRSFQAVALISALIAAPFARAQSSGDPLPGLSEDQLERFEEGRAAFMEQEEIEDGLGPVFNEPGCVNCHFVGGVGGGSTRLETRFGRAVDHRFDPMVPLGGSLLQDNAIGPVDTCNYVPEHVPPGPSVVVAGRRTIPLFGLGLVDAVPDSTFQQLAALQPTAIRGTVNRVIDLTTGQPAVGKFGWKDQNPSLFQFSGDAYLNEMGITNPQFPAESCPQGNCGLLRCNPVPELNDDGDDVEAFTDFMTFLAPPPRGTIDAQVMAGESIFGSLGCAGCHVATLTTGSDGPEVLQNVTFHPYSDFLLHDMDSLGDGIQQGAATERLMRTAPLWGLRDIGTFLHDGRTTNLEDAIIAHAGQAAASRDAFLLLTAADRQALLAFLNSL